MLVKAISQIGKDLAEKDYLRLLMIYFACYDLSPRDRETLLKSIPKECHREVLKNLEYLDPSITMAEKFRRKMPDMTSEEYNEYAQKHSKS